MENEAPTLEVVSLTIPSFRFDPPYNLGTSRVEGGSWSVEGGCLHVRSYRSSRVENSLRCSDLKIHCRSLKSYDRQLSL